MHLPTWSRHRHDERDTEKSAGNETDRPAGRGAVPPNGKEAATEVENTENGSGTEICVNATTGEDPGPVRGTGFETNLRYPRLLGRRTPSLW